MGLVPRPVFTQLRHIITHLLCYPRTERIIIKMAITEFRGEYRFLSSFWPCEISHAGMVFPSVENAFQAAKCLHQEDMKKFIHITPGAAKRKGRKVVIRKGWDEIKRTVMANLLIQKFSYPELQ